MKPDEVKELTKRKEQKEAEQYQKESRFVSAITGDIAAGVTHFDAEQYGKLYGIHTIRAAEIIKAVLMHGRFSFKEHLKSKTIFEVTR